MPNSSTVLPGIQLRTSTARFLNPTRSPTWGPLGLEVLATVKLRQWFSLVPVFMLNGVHSRTACFHKEYVRKMFVLEKVSMPISKEVPGS
ncbi:hypothetical protein C0J52_11919 [Blattella germanica]|nr:hypothetical protein C0J52_11919 [Blattella germanica]